jgi:hypothetical protein
MAEEVITSAKTYVKLNRPYKKGSGCLRIDLEYMEDSKGVRDPQLDAAIPPKESFFVWSLYWDKFRTSGLSFSEISAYEQVSGIRLENWEVDLLFIIHNTVEAALAE